ncbi:MAG: HAMP domain-containing histidine kinase [Clostridiales bacterium]|nr:HAMP domain-containing histidine kinase [Clostridiales bacterium]
MRHDEVKNGKAPFFGVQLRLMLGLFLVFAVSLAAVNLIVTNQIEQTYEEQIGNDLQDLRANAVIYTRQLLVSGGLNNEEEGFHDIAPDILGQFLSTGYERIAAYTTGGILIDRTQDDLFGDGVGDDLQQAVNGRSAFTLIHGAGGRMDAQFSCLVEIEGKTVGILRFDLDYTARRQQGEALSRLVFLVTFIVFLITFFAVEVMARSVTRPVLALAHHTTRVAEASRGEARSEGVSAAELPPTPEEVEKLELRRDEIGRLAVNYDRMLETIREQLSRIRRDRDRIQELYREKQELFNNVTHELKTPLTTIKGYADLLEQSGGKDPILFQKAMRHITEESQRLHEMVVHLLEMADRPEGETASKTDLSAIVRSAVDALEPKARRYGNQFLLEGSRAATVRGYAGRLRELVINLLDNAVKYGEPGGDIRVCLLTDGDKVRLTVTNGGKGLTAQQIEQIFNPFFQADKTAPREPGSAGLGLAICRKIAEEHGGEITVQSTPGVSTAFTVTLPLYEEGEGQG